MKRVFTLIFIILFALQCERGWLREIADPNYNGCTDKTACNFNDQSYEDDGSCAYEIDLCEVCGGDNISCSDCAGTPNGSAVKDNCGTCDSDSSNDCTQDCNGNWGGSAVEDNCGICGGDNSDCTDCLGEVGGTATVDCAGVCGGDAVEDCAGVCGGTSILSGCDNVCNSTAVVDCAGVCGGDNSDCDTVTDIDGNVYQTIQIGEQNWMAENLKTTKYKDGSEIPNITNIWYGDWSGLSSGAYCDYDNNPTNSETYGRLYNWYTVGDSRGLCMEGWHVPTNAEWTILTDYLGGADYCAGKMKEAGTEHWNWPNTGASNESGFTALPAGFRHPSSGNDSNMGNQGFFWSSSEFSGGDAWTRGVSVPPYGDNSVVDVFYDFKQVGFSIRCLGD